MKFSTVICLASATAVLAQPAGAQFGSVFRDAVDGVRKPTKKDQPSDKAADTGCKAAGKASRGSNILGSVLGGAASRTIGRTAIGYYVPVPEVSGILTDAFACKLEPKEQKQAAAATVTATRGEKVGATSSWASEARPGVTGSSTVAGKERLADGTRCMTVRDSAFVNGEETLVTKRMCRPPGAAGYTLAA
jgi:surface antigen